MTDCNMKVFRCEVAKSKELIISYKTIYINLFTTMALDLSRSNSTSSIVFKHECFQRWESTIRAFFIDRTKEYCLLNQYGMYVLGLGSNYNRVFRDHHGEVRMSHSLNSYNFLKFEDKNFIGYEKNHNQRTICVQQEYIKQNMNG